MGWKYVEVVPTCLTGSGITIRGLAGQVCGVDGVSAGTGGEYTTGTAPTGAATGAATIGTDGMGSIAEVNVADVALLPPGVG